MVKTLAGICFEISTSLLILAYIKNFKSKTMKYTFTSLAPTLILVCFVSSVFALKPSRDYKATPEKYAMKYKEEKVATSDGATLNVWYFETPKRSPNYMVISCSGDGNMADNLELISQFLSAGYNVMTYDYRGYGKSSDFEIDADTYIYPQFVIDLNAVLDFLRKYKATSKFELYGTGIGAGLSIGVGANRTETKRIIADGPWVSLEGIKAKIKSKYGKDVIIPFGYDKNFEPQYALEKPKGHLMGVLVIVSPKDELIGPTDIKPLKGIDTYVIKNSPSNKDNFSTDKNAYFEKISAFLKN